MIILPAIDLYNGYAVRLLRGNYEDMTVYSKTPLKVAMTFQEEGSRYVHLVDLEGAKEGSTANLSVIKEIAKKTDLFCEAGGGIRSIKAIRAYFSSGVNRVILGTAAVTDRSLLRRAIREYGDKIAVGADIRDGFVAIRGWTEKSQYSCEEFFSEMQNEGVRTIICTDVSKDGAMQGTNLALYKELSEKFNLNIIASGGVSSIDDIKHLYDMNMYGAIIGKAYYERTIDLSEAIRAAGGTSI